ncbi:MAG: hypothetical protein B6D44_00290 [Ignavibacteriales bacterium UTCHB2]|nr:MAG: hypothetical protein B6D44_00290 [Ignavibacteriales bacterium UTCHB2]
MIAGLVTLERFLLAMNAVLILRVFVKVSIPLLLMWHVYAGYKIGKLSTIHSITANSPGVLENLLNY